MCIRDRNQYFHKNSGRSQDIRFEMKFNIDELFHIDTLVINNDPVSYTHLQPENRIRDFAGSDFCYQGYTNRRVYVEWPPQLSKRAEGAGFLSKIVKRFSFQTSFQIHPHSV